MRFGLERRIFARVAILLLLFPLTGHATVGLTDIPGEGDDGRVTIYYPTSSDAQPVARGPFTLNVAWQGTPVRGNGRLIVISHGSGGSPWVHADLARTLVEQGFVVAMPEHTRDNFKSNSDAGPNSWKRRPLEVSRAVDAVARDTRFAPLLSLDKVGMYGMSAGGHTALTLAGGRWSPSQLKDHCDAHITDDFHSCVGLVSRLTGGFFDGMKKRIALWIIRQRLDDNAWHAHTDPRIAAVIAGVPFAVDFDMTSLKKPRVPLALITAQQDKWLVPRFHSGAVLASCETCEHLADFATGGHGALLSPVPPGLTGVLGELINDPPGFDRSTVPEMERKIAAFFKKHLAADMEGKF